MPRSISIIDYKVLQADFFLNQLNEVGYDFFAAQCYCDAFALSCRSVTFAVQAVCKGIYGFDDWYKQEQENMRRDSILRFFHDYRTISSHIGDSPVKGGATDLRKPGAMRLFFMPTEDLLNVPEADVQTACTECFVKVLSLVYQLYQRFASDLDDRWYYTKEHFDTLGLSIEDTEEALGFPRGWTEVEGTEEELADRWFHLRRTQAIGPQIQGVFHRRLGRIVAGPDDKVEQNAPADPRTSGG